MPKDRRNVSGIAPSRCPRCIHLAGADGTGKTTQARAILSLLTSQGVVACLVWLRFPRIFCVPFLVYARLRGYSHREVVGGNEHGYWEFDRSWLMSSVFPWALLLDTFLLAIMRVQVPIRQGKTVICDRFVVDILADLMVGLNDYRFDERIPGRLFLALLPTATQIVITDLDTSLARQRSPELEGDRTHFERRQAYLSLACRRGWPVICTAASVEQVTAQVMNVISDEAPLRQDVSDSATAENQAGEKGGSVSKERPTKRNGYYGVAFQPWLQPVLRRPLGALCVHWIFQAMLYMDPTERFYKLGLDSLLTLVLGALLGRWMPAWQALGTGFLVAHTLNFLFNGHVFVVLKHFGGVHHSLEAFEAEVDRLRRKVAKERYIVYAAAYGSLARGAWSPTSDLDVRLVRAPGLESAWRVCWFATRERWRAFWRGFPLDIYVLDGGRSLNKLLERNEPVVLGGTEMGIGRR